MWDDVMVSSSDPQSFQAKTLTLEIIMCYDVTKCSIIWPFRLLRSTVLGETVAKTMVFYFFPSEPLCNIAAAVNDTVIHINFVIFITTQNYLYCITKNNWKIHTECINWQEYIKQFKSISFDILSLFWNGEYLLFNVKKLRIINIGHRCLKTCLCNVADFWNWVQSTLDFVTNLRFPRPRRISVRTEVATLNFAT